MLRAARAVSLGGRPRGGWGCWGGWDEVVEGEVEWETGHGGPGLGAAWFSDHPLTPCVGGKCGASNGSGVSVAALYLLQLFSLFLLLLLSLLGHFQVALKPCGTAEPTGSGI